MQQNFCCQVRQTGCSNRREARARKRKDEWIDDLNQDRGLTDIFQHRLLSDNASLQIQTPERRYLQKLTENSFEAIDQLRNDHFELDEAFDKSFGFLGFFYTLTISSQALKKHSRNIFGSWSESNDFRNVVTFFVLSLCILIVVIFCLFVCCCFIEQPFRSFQTSLPF